MKSLRSGRQQHGNTERNRSAKRLDKSSKLDRKSSRGMIYENEELRLRTININAEVERGQTDIKRLRKENEQLRREIWTLRDECDRLNKRVKAKFIEHEQGVYSVRCSGNNGCPCQYNDVGDGCDGVHSECNSEDSDSCESCCCREEDVSPCTDECCSEIKKTSNNAEIGDTSTVTSQNENVANNEASNTVVDKLPSFDHLSVVSEETLSNSEVVSAQQAENKLQLNPEIGGSQATLPSLIGSLTPLTPVELVANELNDLQSVAPPLSYFENILQHHMSTNYGCTPESSSMATSDKSAVKYTNGWDYKLESPFGQSQYQNNSISPTKRLPAQTLTTFVPTTSKAPLSKAAIETSKGKPALPKKPTDLSVKSHQHFIETVPIKTMPSAEGRTQRTEMKSNIGDTTPKNFFSLIKPKLKLNTALANQKRIAPPLPSVKEPSEAVLKVTQLKCEPPDIYVTNALATPYKPPNKLVVQPPLVPQRITSTSTTKAQTDSANLESILNDIEAISEDILAIQLEKSKSRDNSDSTSTDAIKNIEQLPLQQDNKNSKPYRSEMNLLLSYDCDNPTISQAKIAVTADTTAITEPVSNAYTIRRARSLERDHTDSPSPHIPDAMKPFPENHKYIGFDRINKAAVMANATSPVVAATATQTVPVLNSPVSQRSHLPLSPLVTNGKTQKSLSAKQLPPAPPTRSYPTALNIKCAGIARSSSTTSCLQSTDLSTNSPAPARVSPNKSQLYAALANAAAKRAQFRSQPTHLTRTFDAETPTNVKRDCENYTSDEKALENINTRRVSIIACDSDKTGLGEKSTTALRNQIALHPTTGGSCTDLQDIMSNPSLRNLKQTSQSTPNSPHSSRKYENSALPTSPVPPIISITPNSTLLQQCSSSNASAIPQLLAHNHAHSHSYPNVISPLTQQQRQRKNSHDVIRAGAAEIACAAANVMRSKCSRRHSDSTVSHANQRVSGISGATNSTHHHHLHSHHHRQHSSSLASNIHPHLNHHPRRDSNQETVASFSDRNSNSLASSRESSASFSMRSQRRKLSVSSHTGGKIPWCGCWGNGCL